MSKKLFESLTEEDFKNQKNRINQHFLSKESRSKFIRKIRPWNEFFRSTNSAFNYEKSGKN